MRPLVVPAALAVALLAPAGARAQDADPWWGPDKALHFGLSAGLAAGFYGVGTLFLDAPWERALFGGGVALGLGVAKELWDLTGRGQASWRDLCWDLIGVATGLLFAVAVDLVVRATRSGSAPGGAGAASLHARAPPGVVLAW